MKSCRIVPEYQLERVTENYFEDVSADGLVPWGKCTSLLFLMTLIILSPVLITVSLLGWLLLGLKKMMSLFRYTLIFLKKRGNCE